MKIRMKKRMVAQPPPKPKYAGVAVVTSYAISRNPKAYTEHRYARTSLTVMGRIHRYDIPMLIYFRSEISVLNQDMAMGLGHGWKEVEWKMVTADGNRSNQTKVT